MWLLEVTIVATDGIYGFSNRSDFSTYNSMMIHSQESGCLGVQNSRGFALQKPSPYDWLLHPLADRPCTFILSVCTLLSSSVKQNKDIIYFKYLMYNI